MSGLSRFARTFFGKLNRPSNHGKRLRGANRSVTLEPLEERRLLIVNPTFNAGVLTFTAGANDNVIVETISGNVHYTNNGSPEDTTFAASSVTSLIVQTQGDSGSKIDLRGVLSSDFTSLTAVQVRADDSSAKNAHDTIYGSSFDDDINGGEGNDLIYGEGGDDTLDGGEGSDTIYGGADDDILRGGGHTPADTLYGDAGDDTLEGGEGGDELFGCHGNDVLKGENGLDGLWGGPGDDSLLGGADNDTLFGGDGQDTIDGGSGMNSVEQDGENRCPDVSTFISVEGAIEPYSESAIEAVFAVELNEPAPGPISVDWTTVDLGGIDGTTSGQDFVASSGTVNFVAGESTKNIVVPLIDDNLFELPFEKLRVALSNPVGADISSGAADASIEDNEEAPKISISDASASEADGTVDFTISLTGPAASEDIEISWATIDETAKHEGSGIGDYESVSGGVVTITAGSSMQTISVTVNQDALPEADEVFYVTLANPIFGGILPLGPPLFTDVLEFPTAVATIVDDDPSVLDITVAPVINIDENTPTGTSLGTLDFTASLAPDLLPLTWVLIGNTERIAIDQETGELTVGNEDLLDFETTPSYVYLVGVATAGEELVDAEFLTITLNDINDAPVLDNRTLSIDENSAIGTVIGNVGAMDQDATFDPAYEITAGNDAGIFAINATTGDITVANDLLLNFEDVSSHELTVLVRDGGSPELTDSGVITISVNDVNEAPQLDDQTFQVPENTPNHSVVGVVQTTFQDAGENVTYSITAGDSSVFDIDAQTGEILVVDQAQLNFESGSNTFQLTVQATDDGPGSLSDSATITLQVFDVNEAPTIGAQTFSVAENASFGTVIGTIVAGDTDNPADALAYSITVGNEAGIFAIDPETGELFVSDGNLLDFETTDSYQLRVQVMDDGTGTLVSDAVMTINVTDVNEAPISFDQDFTTNEDAANGSIVGIVNATDPDAGDTLSYAITAGNANGALAIDSVTGEITIADSTLVDVAASPIELTVEIEDLAGLTTLATVSVMVNAPANPVSIVLTAIVRDFHADSYSGGNGLGHPDFENEQAKDAGFEEGLVETLLGPDGKPVLVDPQPAGDKDDSITDLESFSTWFNDDSDYNVRTSLPLTFEETSPGSGVYEFIDSSFFPIDDQLFGNEGESHNYHFTMELHATFTYRPGQLFEIFNADDDLWIYIDNNLVVDIGGVHGPSGDTIDLSTLGLIEGETYSFDLFFAERHTTQSHLEVQTTIADLTPVPSGLVLVEDDRFLTNDEFVTNEVLSFVVPAGGTGLSFSYEDLAFDLEDPNSINDAFELALVDANGTSLVPTIAIGRDAFFNITEEQGAKYAVGAGEFNQSVVVDISHLAAGTEARLIARLVGNDGVTDPLVDDTTTVTIQEQVRFFDVSTLPAGTLVVSDPLTLPPRAGMQDHDFDALVDVTDAFDQEYARTSFNEATGILYSDYALEQTGALSLRGDTGPLLVGVKGISSPQVALHQPDGFTPEGIAYYDVSSLAFSDSLDRLENGERVDGIELRFTNPTNVQFDYEIVVLGMLNRGPTFQTPPDPVVEIHTDSAIDYAYGALAVDPDDDNLTYSVLGGPDGLTIDAVTGLVSWSTFATQLGLHEVTLKVEDPDGLFDPLPYTISVVDTPNRPPRFTSAPIVDGYANVQYIYPSAAVDPDGDTLTFSFDTGPGLPASPPDAFDIDPATGIVTWTPTVDQIGQTFPVTLRVTDAHGAFATQSYSILVHPNPANLPPVITSDPSRYFEIAGDRKPAFGDVSVTSIEVDQLDIGQTDPYTVSLTLEGGGVGGGGYADVIVIVDESGSMSGEHDWIDTMIPALEIALLSEGIGDTAAGLEANRYGLVGFGGAGDNREGHSHTFTPDPGMPLETLLWGTSQEFVDSRTTPLVTSGAQEDGYDGLAFALSEYDFRDAAAVNIILITDEDRDNAFAHLEADILAGLQAANAVLNVIVSATYEDPTTGDLALGVSETGGTQTGYYADGTGFVTALAPDPVSSFGTTVADYVEMAWTLEGATWDLNLLRDDEFSESFSNAFVEVKKNEILAQLNMDVRLQTNIPAPVDIPVDLLENVPLGEVATFDLTLNGDGLSHSFMLEFVNNRTNTIVGAIPVIINDEYIYDTNAYDPDDDPITYSLDEMPEGASIDPVTGFIDWVPEAEDDYLFVVRADDGRGGFDLQSFTVTVANGEPNSEPQITSIAPIEAAADVTYYYAVEATDEDQDELSFVLTGTPPPLMSIDSTTGVIEWTPSEADVIAGPHSVTVEVRDLRGGTDSQTFEITVLSSEPVNHEPIIESTPGEMAISGERYRYDVDATDPDADALIYSLVLRPDGMVIDPTSGEIAWTPSEAAAGSTNRVIVSVRDGRGGVDLQAFDLSVISLNESPVIVSEPTLPAVIDELFSYQVVAEDPNGDELSFAIDPYSADELGISINPTSGLLTWTPNIGGTFRVGVQVSDGRGGFDTQIFVLPVLQPLIENVPPRFNSEPTTGMLLGGDFSYEVDVDDANSDPVTLRLDDDSEARGMTLDFSGALPELIWTPGAPGNYAVRLIADDGQGGVTTQSFVLQVFDPATLNQPPTITSTPRGPALAGRLYTYDVNAEDPNGDTLTFSVDQASMARGIVIDPASGKLTWTPTEAGSFLIEVTAGDGELSSTQTFSLPVIANAPPEIITPVPQPQTLDLNALYQYDVDAFDPNQDPFTFSLVDSPSGMSIDPSTGLISWTPTEPGLFVVNIVVTDDLGAQGTQSYELLVINPSPTGNNAPFITQSARTTVQAGQTYTQQIPAEDPDGDPLTFFLENGPDGLTIDNLGLVVWTTDVDDITQPGVPHTFTVRVEDGRGGISSSVDFDINVTLAPAPNSAPEITSSPPAGAVVGTQYRYGAMAIDADNDTLFWQLDDGPQGMAIDPLTGVLTWTPAEHQLGPHEVSIRVVDSQGVGEIQSFTLQARGINLPPSIDSDPPTRATEGQTYLYEVVVTDPEGDPVTLDLVNEPTGMSVVPGTTRIQWTPTAGQIGTTSAITVEATAGGQTVSQVFSIVVSAAASPSAEPPQITSVPPYFVAAGDTFSYTVEVIDLDTLQDDLVFGLPNPPTGLTITDNILTWNTTSQDVDLHDVTVTVSDGTFISTQQFKLEIRENTAPVVTSPGPFTLTEGTDFVLDVRPYINDPDNDPVEFELTGPTGATVDPQGVISWPSPATTPGPENFALTVTDLYGGETVVNFTVDVDPDSSAPLVELAASRDFIPQNDDVTFYVTATDNIGVVSQSIVVTPPSGPDETYPVGPGGRIELLLDQIGTYTVQAEATDAVPLTGTSNTIQIDVYDPNNGPPSVQLFSPTSDLVTNDIVDIVGTISDPEGDDLTYSLRLVPLGINSGASPINLGTFSGARTNEPLGAQIDPTALPNGSYRLELTATDGGPQPVTTSRVINVETDLKLGNFALSFTDLVVPFAGVNLAVVRSYDSNSANNRGDFGSGWDLGLPSTEVDVETIPGSGQSFGPFQFGTRITITLPDGTSESFSFRPQSTSSNFLGITSTLAPQPATFVPDFGNTSTLTLATSNGQVRNLVQPFGSGSEYYDAGSLDFNRPYSPARFGDDFVLTTRGGATFIIDSESGELLELSDPNGNTVRFTGNGMFSDTGLGITFERDWAGRITAAIDPDGNRVEYGYDAAGDLVSVTNRAGEETKFAYTDPNRDHFLTEIIDPRGVSVLDVQFDPNTGRITSLSDASNSAANLSYNLDLEDGRFVETVTDGDGTPTESIRDFRGNVIRVVQHQVDPQDIDPTVYLITIFEYDNNDNQTRVSVPFSTTDPSVRYDLIPEDLVWESESTYSGDNLRSTTDALGNTTYFDSYDSFGNPRTITDPLGNVTRNVYNSKGALTQTTDAEGNVTRFNYDSRGLLEKVVQIVDGQEIDSSTSTYNAEGYLTTIEDAAGFEQTFVYNSLGDQTSSSYIWVDPDGIQSNKTITLITEYDLEGRVTGTRQLVNGSEVWNTATVYNAAGQVEVQRDQFDRSGTSTDRDVVNVYDARGLLIETRTASEDETGAFRWIVSRTVYDTNGRPIYSVDAHAETSTTSDDTGEANPVAAPATHTIYDALGRVVGTQRLNSLLISLVDDPNQNDPSFKVSEESNPGAVLSSTTTVFDSAGRVDHTIGADGLITKFVYDAAGRQIEQIHDTDDDVISPEGEILASRTFYDAAGRVIRTVDALGSETRFEYDSVGRQTAVIGSPVLDEEPGSSTYLEMVRPRSETVYDALGRRVMVRENLKQTGLGEAATVDETDVRETHYEYDSSGRLTAVVLPAVVDDNPNSATTGQTVHPRYEYTYDQYGNQRSIRDYVTQTDPLDPGTIGTTDARVTEFTYDEFHRQVSRTLPIGVATTGIADDFQETTAYNDFGQLTLTVDFEGRHTTFAYDDLGRLTDKQFFTDAASYAGGTGTPDEAVFYTYDALGRQTKVIQDADGDDQTTGDQRVTDHVYDTFGRLTQVVTDEGIVNHAYNDLGQLVRTYTGLDDSSQTSIVGDGKAVTDTHYSYDIFGRLETVTLEERNDDPAVSEQTTYAYDLVGNLDTVTLPNGVVSDYQYDALHRLTLLTHTDGATVLSSYDYELAVNGQRVGVAERDDQDRLTEIDWVYDDLGRLVQEDYDSHDNALDFDTEYLHDLVGNRIEKRTDTDGDSIVDEVISYLYDDNDRLLTETKDAAGTVDDRHTVYEYGPNAISGTFGGDWTVQSKKTVYEGLDDTGTKVSETTSSYNLQGRLEKVDIDSDADGNIDSSSTYEYNDRGIRTSQTVALDTNDDGTVDSTTTTDYVIDNNNHTGYAQVLEEKVASTVEKTYTLGHDVISQQAPADASGSALFLLRDGHGSTRQLVDAAGQPLVGEVYRYDAYGNPIDFDPSAALTTLLYSGEQTDSATGQQYLRARYYDMATGRFNRLDPFAGNMSDPLSLHKYAYVHGDPIQGVDPSGLFSLASSLGGINIGSSLRGINQSSILNAVRVVDRVFDFIETLQFFRDLFGVINSSPLVASHLLELQRSIGNQSGSDYAKLRGLEVDHVQAVVQQLVLDAPVILPRIAQEHGGLIREIGLKTNSKNTRTRPTFVIGLPSLPGKFTGSKFLAHAGSVAGLRVGFAVSETGRGGSLFSLGFKFANSNRIHQIFRVDYHGQRRPTEVTGSATHGRAYLLGPLSGLGDPIRNVGRPVFHYHIPFSSYEK